MKENHRVIYHNLLTQDKLNSYLHNIDIKANKQYDLLVKQLTEKQEISVALNGSRFSVFNTGSKIEVKNKKDLWDVFYRSDESRTRQDESSTGLGLAISKQILLLHKYQYGYTNRPDGVEFYFNIN